MAAYAGNRPYGEKEKVFDHFTLIILEQESSKRMKHKDVI